MGPAGPRSWTFEPMRIGCPSRRTVSGMWRVLKDEAEILEITESLNFFLQGILERCIVDLREKRVEIVGHGLVVLSAVVRECHLERDRGDAYD